MLSVFNYYPTKTLFFFICIQGYIVCLIYFIKFVKSVGEKYQVGKKGREHHGCGEAYDGEKGKGEAISYSLSFWKNITWEKGEGDGNFGEEIHDLEKMGTGKNIKSLGTLYTPVCIWPMKPGSRVWNVNRCVGAALKKIIFSIFFQKF